MQAAGAKIMQAQGVGTTPIRLSNVASTVKQTAVRMWNEDEGGLGSYTNTHASGTTYSGKGGVERMDASARRIANTKGDPVVGQDHSPAATSKESFIDEQNRIDANGGPGGKTYNKINSPGKKLRDGT